MDGPTTFVRVSGTSGTSSTPIRMQADRPGVRDFAIRDVLPDDRGALVNVWSYDENGFRCSVGVLDPGNGRVKIVEEEGANPRYSLTGHLVFSREDALFAVPFDLGRLSARGKAVAVWGGLRHAHTGDNATFSLTRDGSLFYCPAGKRAAPRLAVLDRSGHTEPWSADQPTLNNNNLLATSLDGRYFTCEITDYRAIDGIWIGDHDSRKLRRLETDANADCFDAVWSPDGRQIAYQRTGGDEKDGIYVQEVSGGAPRCVLATKPGQTRYRPTAWLRDGQALLLYSITNPPFRLVRLALDNSPADSSRLRPLLESRFNLYAPRTTPDGRFISFGSDEPGRPETYVAVLDREGSLVDPIQVTTTGGGIYRWSADGQTLFVRDSRGRLLSFSVRTEPRLSVSPALELFDFKKLGIGPFAVMADGRFLVIQQEEGVPAITHYNLVLNWTRELERRMRASE